LRARAVSLLRERLGRAVSPLDLLAIVVIVFVATNFLYGAVLTKALPPREERLHLVFRRGPRPATGDGRGPLLPRAVGSLLAQASVQHPWVDVANAAGVPTRTTTSIRLSSPSRPPADAPLLPGRLRAWLGANVLFLAAALWITVRARGRPGVAAWGASILITGLFYPVWQHLKIGQSSLLVLLLIAASLAFLRRGATSPPGLPSLADPPQADPRGLPGLPGDPTAVAGAGAALAGVLLLSALSAAAVGWRPRPPTSAGWSRSSARGPPSIRTSR